MAKKAILDVLESTIGKYVKNLDAESLNVAVWKGQIELQSLELDIESINAELDRQAAESPNLALPFRVVSGGFGNFQVDVPWSRITSQPVVLRANSLSVVMEPFDRISHADHLAIDEKSEERRIQKIQKQREQNLKAHDEYRQRANALRKLAADDVLRDEGSDDDKQQHKAGFGERLVRRIIENLQVDINDVHISLKGSGSSAGVVLGSLSLFTTDVNGKRTFVDRTKDASSFLFKVLQIDGLGVYLDEAASPFLRRSKDDDHDFILAPLSFQARLRQADSSKCIEFPKYLLKSELSNLSILLSRTQLELGKKIAVVMSPSANVARPLFPEYRPLTRISKESAKDWWIYAFRCVGRLDRRRSWMEFFRAFQKRKQYIPLYKRHAHSDECPWLSPLDEDEKAQLFELEHDRSISFEGIMAWRNMADAQADREQLKYDANLNKKKKEAGGIMAAFFGSTDVRKADSDEEEPPIALSVDEMKELEAISLDQASEAELSDDSRLCDVSFVLGSFRVNLIGHNLKQVAELDMGTVSTSFDANADGSYIFGLNLQSLEVHDKVTPKSVFPTILQNVGRHEDGVFKVSMRKAKNGDQKVSLSLVAFEAVSSPLLITEIKRFFSLSNGAPGHSGTHKNPVLRESLSGTIDLFYDAEPGEASKIDIGKTEDHAATGEVLSDKLSSAMIDAWKNKTRQKAKWTVDCDLHAPILVVPEACTSPMANVLVIDLGHLRLKYGQDESSAKVTGWFETERRLGKQYEALDIGFLSISELTFSIGKVGDDFWRQSTGKSKNAAVIEPLTASLDFGVETQSEGPRICAFGMIPSIDISVSPLQISSVLAVYSGWKPVLKEFSRSGETDTPFKDVGPGAGITIVDEGTGDDNSEGTVEAEVPSKRMTEFFSARGSLLGGAGESSKDAVDAFTSLHFEVSLTKFSVKVLGDTGQGVEAHLVSVSASVSLMSNGVLSSRLCMGWFWILDRLAYDAVRKQRLIAHSNLPLTADEFAKDEKYDVLGELQKIGVFDKSYEGSSDLADITVIVDGSSQEAETDLFSRDVSSIDAHVTLNANLSSLYLHWNPRAVKAMTQSFSKTILAINEAYQSSLFSAQDSRQRSPRRLSIGSGGERRVSIVQTNENPSITVIKAEMKSLQIILDSARDDEPLFTLTMADAKSTFLSLQDNANSMKVDLALDDVRIETPSTGRTNESYNTLLGLAPEHSSSLLSVQYFVGGTAVASFPAEGADVSKCNACAKVELSPMRFVHIQAQVLTLVEYITEGVLGALAAKAASSAAEAALEIAHKEGGENFFAIRATGFDLILPQSAGETEHLSLHTGGLDIDFRGYPYPGGGDVQLALSEVVMQDSEGQKMVGKPIAMSVDVKMAPDSIGDKDDQAMRIDIEIAEAPFVLTHPQYQQIMWTLQGNISEVDPCLREEPMSAEVESRSDDGESETAFEENTSLTHAGVEFVEKENRMYIDFHINVLSLEICASDVNEPIVLIRADQSSVSLKMIPDESTLFTEATLQNLTCEDRRIESFNRPFRSMIHQGDTEAGDPGGAADVFYVSYKNVDSRAADVDLRIGSPQIVLIPDAAAEVMRFLAIEQRDSGDKAESVTSRARSPAEVREDTHQEVQVGSDSNQETIETTLVTFVEGAATEDATNMSISLVTANCSIVLVDLGTSTGLGHGLSSSSLLPSRTRSPDTEVMVLRGMFNAKAGYTTEASTGRMVAANVELHGENMEIFTAFGQDFVSPIQVLEPANTSCFLNLSPRDNSTKELQVRAVTLSPVMLTISMQNAALLNAISAYVFESFGGDTSEQPEDNVPAPLDARQSRRVSQLATALESNVEVESDGSLMAQQESRSISDVSSFNAASDIGDMMTIVSRVNLTFPEASIMVINDLQGLDDALFRLSAKNFVAGAEVVQDVMKSETVDSIRTTFDSNVNMSLMADYFDTSVGLWKALLKRPWELTLKSARGKSRRFQSNRLSTTIDLESFPCQISFSERFLVSLAGANQMWSIYSMASEKASESVPSSLVNQPRKSMAASAARKLITALPYAIENHSGIDISFRIVGESDVLRSCSSGMMRYFRFKPPEGKGFGGQRLYGQDVTQMKGLTIFVEGRELRIDHIDAELSRPRQAHLLDGGRYLLSHVAKEGKTTVRMRMKICVHADESCLISLVPALSDFASQQCRRSSKSLFYSFQHFGCCAGFFA
jgi:hypothetical protein